MLMFNLVNICSRIEKIDFPLEYLEEYEILKMKSKISSESPNKTVLQIIEEEHIEDINLLVYITSILLKYDLVRTVN